MEVLDSFHLTIFSSHFSRFVGKGNLISALCNVGRGRVTAEVVNNGQQTAKQSKMSGKFDLRGRQVGNRYGRQSAVASRKMTNAGRCVVCCVY